jgi:hypothetical protein
MTRKAGPDVSRIGENRVEDWTDHSAAPVTPNSEDVLGGREGPCSNPVENQVSVGKTRDMPKGGTTND